VTDGSTSGKGRRVLPIIGSPAVKKRFGWFMIRKIQLAFNRTDRGRKRGCNDHPRVFLRVEGGDKNAERRFFF